ncbi:hypothetical protein Tco_1091686 [Tanacetum coccineum]|uniref:Uncharacterized protein n=1 Tax=Tanacetum coccineum TaxID=301880 RepID=A0ABQ5I7S1_9ASTR
MYPPHHPSQPQINQSSVQPSQQYQSHQTSFVPQIAYTSPEPSKQPLTEFPQMDSGLAVPIFNQGDDLIACLNKVMAFLIIVASSRFPSTNNQLKTSSNLINQATIQDGKVTVQQVQGMQGQSYAGNSYKGNATSFGEIVQEGRQGWLNVIIVKEMLAEAQEAGQILDEEQLAFLANPGIPDGQAVQTTISNNVAFQTEDLDSYDFDCDGVPHSDSYHNDMDNQCVQAMQDFKQIPVVDFYNNELHSDSNIIPYSQYLQETQLATVQETNLYAQQDSMILSVIEQMSKQIINNVNSWEKANKEKNNKSLTAELERYKERVKTFEQQKLALKEQVDSLEQNLSKQIKENESLLQTFTVFKNESKEKENKYMENEIDLENKKNKLDNIVYKVGYQNPFYLKKAQRIKPTLYEGSVISCEHAAMPVIDDDETLILEEDFRKGFVPQQELLAEQAFWFHMSNPSNASSNVSPVKVEAPSELPKVSLVNESLKKLKFHLAKFDSVVKKRTTPDALTEGEWGLNEITEVQTVFDQMQAVVQQCSVDKQSFEIVKKELLLENDRLLQKIMSQDVMLCVMNSTVVFDNVNMKLQSSESCVKCLDLDAELLKSQNAYNDLSKKYFENNDLKAQLQAKDTTICKLKEHIKSMRENDKEEKLKHEMDEIQTINIKLEHSEAKLLSENEHLHKEIEHLKKIYKDQFDSIKKTHALSKEHCDSLITQLNSKSLENVDLKRQIQDKVFVITSLKNDLRKLKGKEVENVAQIPIATTVAPGMFKLDLDPLAPRYG